MEGQSPSCLGQRARLLGKSALQRRVMGSVER
jgi:hypothetical protein